MGIIEDTLETIRTSNTLSDQALRDLAQNLSSNYAITYTFAAEVGPDGLPLNGGLELARTWVYDSQGGRTGITVGALTAGTADGLPFEGAVEIGIAYVGDSGVSSLSGFAATLEGGYITGAGLTVPLRFADYARNSTEMLNLIASGDTAAAAELLSIAPEGTILFMSNGLQGGAGVEVGLGISDRTQSPEALVTAYTINQAFMSGQSVPDALLNLVANNPELFANADFQSMMQVEIAGKLGPDAYNQFNLDAIKTLANAGRIDLIPEEQQCFGSEVPIDMWPLDPEFAPDPSNPYKQYDQDAVRAKIWKKPIELIAVGDIVVSFDDNDNLVPGPVTRTFQNNAKILLDFHGTRVTPGHVYYRPDSKKSHKYETLIDVLRDDGVIKHQDGTLIRAATNVPVDSPRDGFVRAVAGKRKADGTFVQTDEGRIRLGTRFLVGDGEERKSYAVADLIERNGGVVGADELIHVGDNPGVPFTWDFADMLPKPEDFVLICSGTTLEDIYKAAEWESQGPRLPAPTVLDRGPVQPITGAALSAMPRNEPLHVAHGGMASAKPQRTLNRKQRKAMEAKGRKAAKARKQMAG